MSKQTPDLSSIASPDSSPDTKAAPEKPPVRRKWRMWNYLMICTFLGAGILVAVQIINPHDDTPSQFEALEIGVSRGAASSGTGTQPNSSDARPIDDLTGRLANMVDEAAIEAANHPLDPVLKLADEGLRRMNRTVLDYTATIISQVTIDGVLQPEKRIFCKIRHPRTVEAGSALPGKEKPFGVYLKMLSPASIAGQEAIWVEGQNEDKLIGHTTGMLNLKRVYLDPAGSIAMRGNLHPIYEIGFVNLVKKMGEVGRRDLQHADCAVKVTRDVSIGNRTCTMIEITHETRTAEFEFHIARIYIDQRRDILLGYEGFLWPEQEGDPPTLKEKYFYTDLTTNVGLTDKDFSPDNKDYDYPSW